jgi:hypothetical protein
MKTRSHWLCVVLLLTMAPAWAAEVPEELKQAAHRLEFVAQLARRCDTDMRIFGADGIYERDCQMFVEEFTQAQQTIMGMRQGFLEQLQEAERSGNVALKRQFDRIGDEMMVYLEVIEKTGQRMQYWQEAEQRQRKSPRQREPKR